MFTHSVVMALIVLWLTAPTSLGEGASIQHLDFIIEGI
jgi:hypothetical protein